jgi:hypothetical protein
MCSTESRAPLIRIFSTLLASFFRTLITDHRSLITFTAFTLSLTASAAPSEALTKKAMEHFETYCFSCHDEDVKKGDVDLYEALASKEFDGKWAFENLITHKMPPAKKKQPTAAERQTMLDFLVARQPAPKKHDYRRISRHEFVQSVNDLLGTKLDLAKTIPDDRGTNYFDTDRRIKLSTEQLSSYFSVADRMLEEAFPADGHLTERVWVTGKIRDSHETYRIYHRPYKEGTLLSWTRANNGNSYSFFIDGFEPPVPGWYELTFDAAKVGGFPEDVSLQVFAGKYYYADDRPQPQRLIDVISLANSELKSFTVRGYLHPGESVSVHAYSKHNFRQRNPKVGAYLKQMKARGPLLDGWPTVSYQTVFAGLPIAAQSREVLETSGFQTNLQKIGGSITVSSEQPGMEKEKMQDGSNLTFWHTRYTPTVAKPPHYVDLHNPKGATINGLSFATWTGGNGNGLVKAYEIYFSEDGKSWGNKVMDGGLDVRLGNEQYVVFPEASRSSFIRFLVTDAVSLDGKSIASIGKLDVTLPEEPVSSTATIAVSGSADDLRMVIKRFAERAFASTLTENEMAPYYQVGLDHFGERKDFVAAAKVGIKSIITSHRFLIAPGAHKNQSQQTAADLARTLWLSVPDPQLSEQANADTLKGGTLRKEIERMLAAPQSERMVHSFCSQWLNLRGLNKVAPSLKLYPAYNDLLNHSLPLETEAYFANLIADNHTVSHLIDSDFTFLNQRLAQHYEVPGIYGQHLRKVKLPANSPRGGLMTMASILKVTADGFQTSPILRGAWVSKNIVGTTLSPPPPLEEVTEPDHSGHKTLKQQIDEHKKNKACYACHKSIDPYGFALENFDATGAWRTKYTVETPHPATFMYRPKGYFKVGASVDASSEINDVAFDDIAGLKKLLLSDHKKLSYNLMRKFYEYANGKEPNLQQRLDLYAIIPDNRNDARVRDLLVDVLLYSSK